jgi:hypothetical protein
MDRILFWSIGIFILVLLAFIPMTFQVNFRLANRISFNLSGESGTTCVVGLMIGLGIPRSNSTLAIG